MPLQRMGFLDLPAELRLRIYELHLGGRTLHIGDPLYPASEDEDRVLACQVNTPDMDLQSRSIESINDLFTHRHMTCSKVSAFSRDDFSLLLVCRHIHHEAASVPFSANTFAFSAPRLILKLQSRLTAAQMDSISHVLLYQSNYRKYWRGEGPSYIPDALTGALPGLTHLSLYFETCPADLGASNSHYSSASNTQIGINDPAELANVFHVTSELKGPKLMDVQINVVDTTRLEEYRKGGSICVPLDEDAIEVWKSQAKRRLLVLD
ncbi:hypothetical protein B0A50_04789 [Salinomyces thailandicus]|uniref:DUF7730 domain-containing protein n=1 Tax=Salinomyces thailandicus TaxID=706561 RepID=A0A4U0TW99_9PEZI|nr:hypothetical protein B0A50_04789 [Salinomyces thailandica]